MTQKELAPLGTADRYTLRRTWCTSITCRVSAEDPRFGGSTRVELLFFTDISSGAEVGATHRLAGELCRRNSHARDNRFPAEIGVTWVPLDAADLASLGVSRARSGAWFGPPNFV